MTDDDFGAEESVSLRPGGGGGVWLNTSAIGSKAFSEFDLAGQLHDGVRLVEAKVKVGGSFKRVDAGEVIDGNLRAKIGKTYYSGAQMVDSRWKLSIPNYDYNHDDDQGLFADNHDRTLEIWVSAYTAVSPKEGHYTFKFIDDQGAETFICDADGTGSHASIPVKNVTVDRDTGDLTARPLTAYLACTSGAIGKAITWGYKPWERSVADLEVASRMVRADYCYDGMSWTETGIALQVRDAYAINDFLHAEDSNEVLWTTTGVACLNQPRNSVYSAPQVTCNGQPLPTCAPDVSLTSYPGSLFWTKLGLPQ